MFNKEKLKDISQPISDKSKTDMEFRLNNSYWLRTSVKIALTIRKYMSDNNLSPQDMSSILNKPDYFITKLISGEMNMSLDIICLLESKLNLKILNPNLLQHENYK